MSSTLGEHTVVMTGGSSGIGLEAALAFARRGARVVLAARSGPALEEAARLVEQAGGRARAVVTDVADWEQVRRLAAAAVAWTGRIDTWVNNAAVMTYGTLEQMEVEEIERVLRVNVMGVVHGMKAAIPHMKAQGSGTIINVASILAHRALPFQAAYGASKHAVRGLTDAVRIELEREGSPVQLSLLEVGSTDTPIYDHARTKLGRKPRALRPIHHPSVVGAAIVELARRPRRAVAVGAAGKLLTVANAVAPRLVDAWLLQGDRGYRSQVTDEPDDGVDNLFAPVDQTARSTGRFTAEARRFSVYTWLRLAVTAPFALLAGAARLLTGASDAAGDDPARPTA